ncbi:LPS export ABC transporter periplasmic protein LptC [Massilia sp. TS11]|uniref:LPS export ABC transporter periplasmic protein LptC n=1 Tax=Massilia sp. TS11 TaxID=2908003 RepID=UPI001EDA35AF|nr:LPS export ABC transporter periplasmic protein LptC [Massilia sp. TS11]MCG2584956.1 LPS export ABC transporter periplasmic protein LptC [Massilia sp. TS11]
MHKRTAHRWRLGAVLIAGALFALGSFWLLQLMRQSEADLAADAAKNDPDYIVEKFSFVRMSPQGKPAYIVSGARMTHRPLDDSSLIETPVVQSLSAEAPPMVIHAAQAHVVNNNSEVRLTGGVSIVRPASAAARGLDVRTEAVTLFPDDEHIKTDLPVTMQSGRAQLSGTGLFIDNTKQEISILSQVRSSFPPHGR